MKQILVIAEIFEGEIRQVTWELAAAALEIQAVFLKNQHSPGSQIPKIQIIVPSDNPKPLTEEILKETGIDVIGVLIPELTTYTSEIYITCLGKLMRKMNPSHILAAHTSQGRDFAPGLSLELDAASISGVNCIGSHENGLIYTRSVFENKKDMLIRPDPERLVVLTLIPGAFKPKIYKNENPGKVDIRSISFETAAERRIHSLKITKRSCENQALKGAKVVVAAGRGLEEKENLSLVFKFAKALSSSAVGASRPLVDMNWIGYEHQVGITGAIIAPEIYIACGISGSSQHIAGMENSKWVISINKNPSAPIFRYSDICIIEDVNEFIHAFLKLADTIDSGRSSYNKRRDKND